MTLQELTATAVGFGAECIDTIARGFPLCEVVYLAEEAFHYAGLARDRQRAAQAPVMRKLVNAEIARIQAANRPRCVHRNTTLVEAGDGSEPQWRVGSPCGGKLKGKRLHGQFVGVECVLCGRYQAKPVGAPPQLAESGPASSAGDARLGEVA